MWQFSFFEHVFDNFICANLQFLLVSFNSDEEGWKFVYQAIDEYDKNHTESDTEAANQARIDSLSTKHYLQHKQTQCNLIVKPNQKGRTCHTPISHWLRNLGYIEFMLQLTFDA